MDATHTLDGRPVSIVGYRDRVKGPILDHPARYVVFIERCGDYRIGTIRAWRVVPVDQEG